MAKATQMTAVGSMVYWSLERGYMSLDAVKSLKLMLKLLVLSSLYRCAFVLKRAKCPRADVIHTLLLNKNMTIFSHAAHALGYALR